MPYSLYEYDIIVFLHRFMIVYNMQYATHDQLFDNLSIFEPKIQKDRENDSEKCFGTDDDDVKTKQKNKWKKITKRNTVNSVWFTSNGNLCRTWPTQSNANEKPLSKTKRFHPKWLKQIKTNNEQIALLWRAQGTCI